MTEGELADRRHSVRTAEKRRPTAAHLKAAAWPRARNWMARAIGGRSTCSAQASTDRRAPSRYSQPCAGFDAEHVCGAKARTAAAQRDAVRWAGPRCFHVCLTCFPSSCLIYFARAATGYIAQWLERLTADQQVPGSKPGVPYASAGKEDVDARTVCLEVDDAAPAAPRRSGDAPTTFRSIHCAANPCLVADGRRRRGSKADSEGI